MKKTRPKKKGIPFISNPEFVNKDCPYLRILKTRNSNRMLYTCVDKDCMKRAKKYDYDCQMLIKCCMVFPVKIKKVA